MIKHNRSSHSTILPSDFSSPPHHLCRQFSFSSKPCVRMGQSLLRAAHFPVKLVFYRSQPWRGKSRTPISAPFCAYATVINETPGVSFIKLCVGSLLKMCVRPEAKFCVRQKIFRFIKHCVRTPVRNLCFINHILTIIVRS